jgi:hypothetical protein
MPKRKMILDASLADALLKYCESTFILPDDLLRLAIQQHSREPFLIDARQVTGRDQTERMLKILAYLWRMNPETFEKAAAGIHGHKRVWFSKSEKEIWESGSSNSCQKIGDSPWFVSTNCPMEGMMSRVEKVMRGMGFSSRYTSLVAWSIYDREGRIYPSDFFENEKRG